MSTPTTQQPDIAHLEELADEYTHLAAEHERITARMEELKAHFRALPAGHTHDIGPLAITVSRNARLNTRALARTYPPETHPELYASKIDTTRAREVFDEDMLEDFTSEGAAKVTVKVTGDPQGETQGDAA